MIIEKSLTTPFVQIMLLLGDYRNSFFRPNAQKSQIFDLVKSDALPHFLAKPGQIVK